MLSSLLCITGTKNANTKSSYLTDTAQALVDGVTDPTFVYDSDKNAMTWAGTSLLPTLQFQEASLFGSSVSLAGQPGGAD